VQAEKKDRCDLAIAWSERRRCNLSEFECPRIVGGRGDFGKKLAVCLTIQLAHMRQLDAKGLATYECITGSQLGRKAP
jgi:hypothetical protein